jgi:hypothetical protein
MYSALCGVMCYNLMNAQAAITTLKLYESALRARDVATRRRLAPWRAAKTGLAAAYILVEFAGGNRPPGSRVNRHCKTPGGTDRATAAPADGFIADGCSRRARLPS